MSKKFENKTKAQLIDILLNPWPWIIAQCNLQGWSSQAIATMAGVSASGVRALLNGQNKRPSAETLQKLLKLCIDNYTGEPSTVSSKTKKRGVTNEKPVTKKKVVKKKVAKKKASKKPSLPGWLK